MKKIINIFLVPLASVLMLNACDQAKTDVNPNETAVPGAVISGLRQAFPNAEQVKFTEVEKQTVWGADFKQSSQSMEAKLNQTGTVLEAFRVAATNEQLPAVVQTYLNNTYRGFTVTKWSVSTDNPPIYRVTLEQTGTRLVVEVDANGRFINRITENPASQAVAVYTLQLKDLPQAVQAYLQPYTFLRAAITLIDGKKTYAISAQQGDNIYLFLFDEAWVVIKSEIVNSPASGGASQQVTQAQLPPPIINYLNNSYPGWTFRQAQTTFSNGQATAYQVTFTHNSRSYIAYFDAKGDIREVKPQ